jgi:hypothetical protein
MDFETDFIASVAPRKVNILPSFFGGDSRRGPPCSRLAKKNAVNSLAISLR